MVTGGSPTSQSKMNRKACRVNEDGGIAMKSMVVARLDGWKSRGCWSAGGPNSSSGSCRVEVGQSHQAAIRIGLDRPGHPGRAPGQTPPDGTRRGSSVLRKAQPVWSGLVLEVH